MSLSEMVKNGAPLKDILVIDDHCHMGSTKLDYIPGSGSPQSIINEMDNLGIDIACVAHNAAILPGDIKWGNDRVIEAIQKYPGRFIGYCAISPFYPEDIPGELDRCFRIDGIKAIKIVPSIHERTMAYKSYKILYEYAARNGCHVLVHVYSVEEIRNMDKYASEYPNVDFIMAHMGGEVAHMEFAIDVLNRHDNVYGDFAVSRSWEGIVEWFVREVGSKKLLFGSDMPWFDPRPTLSRIALADISEEEKRDILGLNMKKILKI